MMAQSASAVDLDVLLRDAFVSVRERFGHVPLRQATWSDEPETADIHMGSFAIRVNPQFIAQLAERISPRAALDGVLDHEVGHYAFHPYDLKRVILESFAMREKEHGESIRQFYDDVNNNLRVVASKGDLTTIPEVYKALAPSSRVERVILGVYQELTGRDFGLDPQQPDEIVSATKQLLAINYLNYAPETGIEFVKRSERLNLSHLNRFYAIVKPLFDQDAKDGNTPQPGLGDGSPSPNDASGSAIRKALKDLIKDGQLGPSDAKKFLDTVKDRMKEENGNFPGGSYNDNPDLFADRFVYESFALRYKITLKKRPLIGTGGAYPTRHEKFEVGDDVNLIDPFNSYGGRVLPGLSNKWVKETVRYLGEKEKTPDLVILLDDSDSMTDPVKEVSRAVLGANVVAREYLENGAAVAVVRFSDRTTVQGFSKDRDMVLNECLRFKKGDDTIVDLKKLKSIESALADYLLITDAAIKNYDAVIEYLSSRVDQGGRAYVLRIGGEAGTSIDRGVKIIGITSNDDIGAIVLDDIHRGDC